VNGNGQLKARYTNCRMYSFGVEFYQSYRRHLERWAWHAEYASSVSHTNHDWIY